mgnify:CR=1 FL=1
MEKLVSKLSSLQELSVYEGKNSPIYDSLQVNVKKKNKARNRKPERGGTFKVRNRSIP